VLTKIEADEVGVEAILIFAESYEVDVAAILIFAESDDKACMLQATYKTAKLGCFH
jgi:hypothetical protein